jgi:hypothetical protein
MNWAELQIYLSELMGKRPEDLNSVLYLIGVQELGKGFRSFSKEEKQDLIHIGACKALSLRGHYEFVGTDEEGWPHYSLVNPLQKIDIAKQEELLKSLVGEYFQKIQNESN